ncbi:hypothetical protein [Enterobacter asburiae]|uniref:hypothetical protein n=1 Tax=Enterobacter asburiae TaxID=61645 RepID=UPI0032AF5C1D
MIKNIATLLLILTATNAYSQSIYCGRAEWQSSNGVITTVNILPFTLRSLNSKFIIMTRPKGRVYLESVTLKESPLSGGNREVTSGWINHVSQNTNEYDYWETTSTFPFQLTQGNTISFRRITSTTVDDSYVNNYSSDYQISFTKDILNAEGVNQIDYPGGGKQDNLFRYVSSADIEDVIEVPGIIAGESVTVPFATLHTGRMNISGGGTFSSSGVAATDNPGVTIKLEANNVHIVGSSAGINVSTLIYTTIGGGNPISGLNSIYYDPAEVKAKINTTNDAEGAFSRTFTVTADCS